MLRLAVRELVSRQLATTLAAAGLLTAVLGFVVLGSTAKTTQAVLTGDIRHAWDTPYDLLIRPAGSVTELEASRGLIRPNYVSGLLGGITPLQLASIRGIRGVEVAAPIAMVGFVNWPSAFLMRLRPSPASAPLTVYRVRAAATGDGGLSRFPIEDRYVVISTKGDYTFSPGGSTLSVNGGLVDCSGSVNCFARRVCGFGSGCETGHFPSVGDSRYYLPLLQPLVIAGIDPVAEARIAGLDRCVTSGRYLRVGDVPRPDGDPEEPFERIPVLTSSRPFVDETLSVRVSMAGRPDALLKAGSPEGIHGWKQVQSNAVSFADLYRAYLPSLHDYMDPWPIWSSGEVGYTQAGSALKAGSRAPRLSIYERANRYSEVGIDNQILIPPEASDAWFRTVKEHLDVAEPAPGSPYRAKLWDAVGVYNPLCIPGFDPLNGGRFETYSLPAVRLPGGGQLGPTRSMAGYVSSPPLLLTTLEGARWLADPHRYAGQPGRAFISVIRVKVDGVDAPGPESEARLKAVAVDIHEATGLQVDVVKGSSTRAVHVELPAGNFGRPALTVSEAWWSKGVAIRFVEAVRAQDLALLSIILLAAAALVGETAYIAVKRRREEFGVLRALGWPVRRIIGLVELEMVVLSAAIGLVATGAGVLVVRTVAHDAPLWIALLGFPLAVVIGGIAGAPPAISAGRGTTTTAMRKPGRVRRSHGPRGPISLGLRDLAGPWRVEAMLGVLGMAVGSALLGGVVLVATNFGARLDTTTLGTFLTGRVHPFHVALAALTLGIGGLAAGQVVTLGYLERQTQLAALRALGWPRGSVGRMLVAQAIVLGLFGGAIGAVLVWGAGTVSHMAGGHLALAAAAALLVAPAATAVAAVSPLLLAYRAGPAELLRGE